jgi:hypothetical protein
VGWSNESGKQTAAYAERKIQYLFMLAVDDKRFKDGFVVGAMFFHARMPGMGKVQSALGKIGLSNIITPITKATDESRNYEIRVWDRGNIEGVHRIIMKRGADVASAVSKPFRWKDLRNVYLVVVRISGLPFQWDELLVRKGLFDSLGFLTQGLKQETIWRSISGL